jgi:ureidoglycolate lyase
MTSLKVEPLTAEAFAPYGIVLAAPKGVAPMLDRGDITAWIGFADLSSFNSSSCIWAQLNAHRHNMPVTQLERHTRCPEAFIPLQGMSVLVVAPCSDPSVPDCKPDESQIRAFLVDGSAGVLFPAGAWHWAPYAITEEATFLLIGDQNMDIEVQPIAERHLELY